MRLMSSEELTILLISHYTFVVWLGIMKTLRSRAVWTLVHNLRAVLDAALGSAVPEVARAWLALG